MPCSDSSSSLVIKLDKKEKFLSFDYAKITCGREISGGTGFSQYCVGKELIDILNLPFALVNQDLAPKDDESQFILYLEWDALRSAIAQFLGVDHPDVDRNRCLITSVDYTQEGIEIAEVILPPKELPKILPCSLAEKISKNNN